MARLSQQWQSLDASATLEGLQSCQIKHLCWRKSMLVQRKLKNNSTTRNGTKGWRNMVEPLLRLVLPFLASVMINCVLWQLLSQRTPSRKATHFQKRMSCGYILPRKPIYETRRSIWLLITDNFNLIVFGDRFFVGSWSFIQDIGWNVKVATVGDGDNGMNLNLDNQLQKI